MEKKIYLIKFVTSIFAATLLSCSIYHMQTPQTLPPGKWVGGAALSAFGGGESGGPLLLPGLWVRRGITPRFDVGIHTWMIGLKVDGKYNIVKDYFSAGLGLGGGTMWWGSIVEYRGSYIVEGLLYAGYPGKVISPYAVGRLGAVTLGEWQPELFTSAVGGLRFRLGKKLSLFIEGGVAYPLMQNPADTSNFLYTGGIGVSIEY